MDNSTILRLKFNNLQFHKYTSEYTAFFTIYAVIFTQDVVKVYEKLRVKTESQDKVKLLRATVRKPQGGKTNWPLNFWKIDLQFVSVESDDHIT